MKLHRTPNLSSATFALALCIAGLSTAYAQAPAGSQTTGRLEIQGNVSVSGIPELYESVTITCRLGQPGFVQEMKLPLTLTTSCKTYGPSGFLMVFQGNPTPLNASGTYACDLTFHMPGGYVIAANASKKFNAPGQSASISGRYSAITRGTVAKEASVTAPPLTFAANNRCKP
jgi:hypothetical protein